MANTARLPMRIRNVQPKVFQNYELDDAEFQMNLPLFKFLVGLWCHADREGRFVWDTRKLQAHIFPYRPQVDITAMLGVLEQQAVIAKYEIDGKEYGWLPTFTEYQYLSRNEPQSILPAPPNEGSGSVTRVLPERSVVRRTKDEGHQTTVMGADELQERLKTITVGDEDGLS